MLVCDDDRPDIAVDVDVDAACVPYLDCFHVLNVVFPNVLLLVVLVYRV